MTVESPWCSKVEPEDTLVEYEAFPIRHWCHFSHLNMVQAREGRIVPA
jgi:hypothetical protein